MLAPFFPAIVSTNGPTVDSPIRLIDDVGPVKGDSNPNLACGQDAQAATLVASANPGSALSFAWAGGDGGVVRTLSPFIAMH